MNDINTITIDNILETLKHLGKKQIDLAEGIGVSKQTMSKMLNGGQSIKAVELQKIADYLGVSSESLRNNPKQSKPKDVIHTFKGKCETDEVCEAFQIADKVSDLILFHKRVRKNGISMMKPMEE